MNLRPIEVVVRMYYVSYSCAFETGSETSFIREEIWEDKKRSDRPPGSNSPQTIA